MSPVYINIFFFFSVQLWQGTVSEWMPVGALALGQGLNHHKQAQPQQLQHRALCLLWSRGDARPGRSAQGSPALGKTAQLTAAPLLSDGHVLCQGPCSSHQGKVCSHLSRSQPAVLGRLGDIKSNCIRDFKCPKYSLDTPPFTLHLLPSSPGLCG